MYQTLHQRCQRIRESAQLASLKQSRYGLEKESLRVAESGGVAQTPHPPALGSALTNPYITTDFSEALTEMITPPCHSIREALDFLKDIQKFVYSHLSDEILWATSMPCVVEGGDSIPIARYGTSNSGMMKHVYRRGLGYRYGRTMQVIAGVHFNYSFSQDFWLLYQQLEHNKEPLQDFINHHYMGLVRNMLRNGWLVLYLFGASPAVCNSFIQGKRTILSAFNDNTAYEPYATSLRMGDIGYTNSVEDMAGIKANYESVETYIKSLRCAIETPYDDYQAIGVKVDGQYRQLNANILQIENEYYSTVRPKQVLIGNEKPTHALAERGIGYIELRSLDVNAFDPLGVDEQQLCFLETLMLFCLLQDSPVMSADEMNEIDINLLQVAHFGRRPDLELSRNDQAVTLKKWAQELLQAMREVASLLDSAHGVDRYSNSLVHQQERVRHPELTVSAMMLKAMRNHDEGFFHFGKRMSMQHYHYFQSTGISAARRQLLEQAAEESLIEQERIEQEDSIDFDTFLQQYFASP